MVRRSVLAAVVAALATVVVFVAAPGDADAQCSMCRTALEGSEQGKLMAEKFNRGILFLLGAPFTVVAGVWFAARPQRPNRTRSNE